MKKKIMAIRAVVWRRKKRKCRRTHKQTQGHTNTIFQIRHLYTIVDESPLRGDQSSSLYKLKRSKPISYVASYVSKYYSKYSWLIITNRLIRNETTEWHFLSRYYIGSFSRVVSDIAEWINVFFSHKK